MNNIRVSTISKALIKAAFVTAFDTLWSSAASITALIFLCSKFAEIYSLGWAWDCLPTEPVTVPYFLEDGKSLIYAPQGILGNIISLVLSLVISIMAFVMSRVSWNMFTFVVDISGMRQRPTTGMVLYAEYMIVRFLFVVCIMANLYLHRVHKIPMYTISIIYILRCMHINPLFYMGYEILCAIFAYIYISTLSNYFHLRPELEEHIEHTTYREASVLDYTKDEDSEEEV